MTPNLLFILLFPVFLQLEYAEVVPPPIPSGHDPGLMSCGAECELHVLQPLLENSYCSHLGPKTWKTLRKASFSKEKKKTIKSYET